MLHTTPQRPASHTAEPPAGEGQRLLHAPQWFVSEMVATHAPAQRVSPVAQLDSHAQAPPRGAHAGVGSAHATAQPPQVAWL